MRFRPCIDLRDGHVVQIVGGSLRDQSEESAVINFETLKSPVDYALMFREDGLVGGHVISLGPGNREAALSALSAFPGGLQMGGGITPGNADEYLNAGASHVIVTSYVFTQGLIDMNRLETLVAAVGEKKLVLDLSCRKKENEFLIVTDRWQTFTQTSVNPDTLKKLAKYCVEFLVHGVDVEGKMQGIQEDLVEMLGEYSPIPVTYAGGVKSLSELDKVKELGRNRVDLTIGSALDIFGGHIPYRKVVEWNKVKG
jgi:phosphoribosylformimino-5-aminoimidazole carboxamide ribotide isomerase